VLCVVAGTIVSSAEREDQAPPDRKILLLGISVIKINELAFINMCLDVAKSSDRHEEEWQHQNITLQMVVCGCCLSH